MGYSLWGHKELDMTEHAQLDPAVSQDDQGYLARCDCYYLLSIDRGIYLMSNVFHLHYN